MAKIPRADGCAICCSGTWRGSFFFGRFFPGSQPSPFLAGSWLRFTWRFISPFLDAFAVCCGHVPAKNLFRAANINGHRRSLTSRHRLFVCRGSVHCIICFWHLVLPPAGRRWSGYVAGFSPVGGGMGLASHFTSISRSFKSPSTPVSRAFRSWLRLRMSSRFRQSIASFWKQIPPHAAALRSHFHDGRRGWSFRLWISNDAGSPTGNCTPRCPRASQRAARGQIQFCLRCENLRPILASEPKSSARKSEARSACLAGKFHARSGSRRSATAINT